MCFHPPFIVTAAGTSGDALKILQVIEAKEVSKDSICQSHISYLFTLIATKEIESPCKLVVRFPFETGEGCCGFQNEFSYVRRVYDRARDDMMRVIYSKVEEPPYWAENWDKNEFKNALMNIKLNDEEFLNIVFGTTDSNLGSAEFKGPELVDKENPSLGSEVMIDFEKGLKLGDVLRLVVDFPKAQSFLTADEEVWAPLLFYDIPSALWDCKDFDHPEQAVEILSFMYYFFLPPGVQVTKAEIDGKPTEPRSFFRPMPQLGISPLLMGFFEIEPRFGWGGQRTRWFLRPQMPVEWKVWWKQILPEPKCFVAMPFSKEFDDIYDNAIKPAVEALGLSPIRVDKDVVSKNILDDKILEGIRSSDVIVADLTGVVEKGKVMSNPNVMFEVGYAIASARSVVLISQKLPDRHPFDIRPRYIHQYKAQDLQALKHHLIRAIAASLKLSGS